MENVTEQLNASLDGSNMDTTLQSENRNISQTEHLDNADIGMSDQLGNISIGEGNISLTDSAQISTPRSGRGSSAYSSDIEILHEEKDSSSSIEVLDTDLCAYDQQLGSVDKTEVDLINLESPMLPVREAVMSALQSKLAGMEEDCGTSRQEADQIHDSMSNQENSDTATLTSTSSSTLPSDGPSIPSRTNPDQGVIGSYEDRFQSRHSFSSYEDISQENTELVDSPASSSVNQSPYDSPTHRGYIPLDSNGLTRPDSLSLPKPLQYYERQRLSKKSSCSSLSSYSSRSSSMDALIEAATETPLHQQGTVTMDGDMIAFVAEGLENMIKMSSPLSTNHSSNGSHTPSAKSVSSVSSSNSGWSVSGSSASGYTYSGISRSPSVLTASPDDIPPVDPRALMELETHARKVANSVHHMMGVLKTSLHRMSFLTLSCLETYEGAVDTTCDSVDASIKSMYALMAKCEEVSHDMKPIYHVHTQVKDIKRLLDMFEALVAKDPS